MNRAGGFEVDCDRLVLTVRVGERAHFRCPCGARYEAERITTMGSGAVHFCPGPPIRDEICRCPRCPFCERLLSDDGHCANWRCWACDLIIPVPLVGAEL